MPPEYLPFAQKHYTDGGYGVEDNPEGGDQRLRQGDLDRFCGGFVLGQLVQLLRLVRIDVVDEALARRALLSCGDVSAVIYYASRT